jgi:hypothetical protein
MNYTEYQYLWPPRPETKVSRTMLGFWERKGYISQVKKNGTCTMIFARGDKVIFKTRHNEDHKLWTPQPDHIKFFQGSKGWNVYVAELLHSKVTGGPKHELYIFDQLVSKGNSLVGTSFDSRQLTLRQELQGVEEDDQFRVAPRITLAKCLRSGFTALFDNLKKEDEGLVLKDPKAVLKPCLKPDSNKGWSVKCRIAAANYSF